MLRLQRVVLGLYKGFRKVLLGNSPLENEPGKRPLTLYMLS